MTEQPKISKPILKCLLEQPDDPDAPLTEITVQTDNRDAVRFDVMRARMNWPGGDVAPMLWMTVQAWSALKRSKATPWSTLKVDQFFDCCVDLTPVDADGNTITNPDQIGGLAARPTVEANASD